MCRAIWAHYDNLAGVSVLLQVNGDGRSWVRSYEPGAHGVQLSADMPPSLDKYRPLGHIVGTAVPSSQ